MSETKADERIESELDAFLQSLDRAQQDLIDLLAAKRRCAAEGDWEGLDRLRGRHDELLARLDAMTGRREELLRQAAAAGYAARDLTDLARHLPRRAALDQRLRQATARMRLVQHESLAAWVVTQRAVLHLAHLLELLATGGEPRPTYGRHPQEAGAGAMVDERV